jgi:lysophospholipase L1-like esterase
MPQKTPWILGLLPLVFLAFGSGLASIPDNPAVAPEARPGPWLKQHEGYVAIAARGNIDLLFLGDSITALWDKTAPGVWSRHYAPRRAANFGIGGDRTQNLLWRIDHGELDGLKPKVVVLMVGTNNVPLLTEDQVFDGIKAVIDRIQLKLPESKILLLGLTPRGLNRDPKQLTTAPDPRIHLLNVRLAALESAPKIRYLDIGPALLDNSGQLTQAMQPDFLHLSRKAYQTWADAMEPLLWEMMEGDKPAIVDGK